MFGKLFESTFYGSMVGAGSHVFAVWSYVISHMKPCAGKKFQVSLNAKVLSFIIGETEGKITDAIDYLCKPDEQSRSKESEGRRLLKIGEYEYIVVNGAAYNKIRSNEELRQKNRDAQHRFREKQKMAMTLPEKAFIDRESGEAQPEPAPAENA